MDPKGTFNYTIDQDHLFFRGEMPIGTYEVLVTGSGGRRATAKFRVDRAATPPASAAAHRPAADRAPRRPERRRLGQPPGGQQAN